MQFVAKHKHKFEALGTVWWLETDSDSRSVLLDAEVQAHQFEQRYSRFKSNSLLFKLNRAKRLEQPPAELIDMLNFAISAAQSSQGVFNITSGVVLSQHGYGPAQIGEFRHDWVDGIQISDTAVTIDRDIALDFGGFGKGWLVDTLLAYIRNKTDASVLVNGGGDIGLQVAGGVDLPLMMPGDHAKYVAKVRIHEGALASSSPLVRRWQLHNHLVAESGMSYSGEIAQLSAYAASASLADMAATSCIVADDPFAMARQLDVELFVLYGTGKYRASPNFPLSQV